MRHRQNSPAENMHPLIEGILVSYANLLRAKYPGRKIRNRAVFASGIPAFACAGYIELVDARTEIPKGIPEFLIVRIKRTKDQPIWIPSINFPENLRDIYHEMKPSLHGDAVVWRHSPSNVEDRPAKNSSNTLTPLINGRV